MAETDARASAGTPVIAIEGLTKSFGANQVLKGVDLSVGKGEVVAIIGPSGSGKTTLLRCINFLEEYDGGSIRIDGTEVGYRDGAGARKRRSDRELAAIRVDAAMVFQQFNLFPHLTAAQNIMLGLMKSRGRSKAEARAIAEKWLARVGLSAKVDAMPSQMSGGQQQRVGIARALAANPRVLIADEPTGQLDSATAEQMMTLIAGIVRARGVAAIVSTHDPKIAEHADRVLRMRAGRLE